MEQMCDPNEAEAGLEDLPMPGLEEFLTSDVVLDLLKMPKDGFIRISAALFFLGNSEMFAFYWRDTHGGKQYCKLLTPDAVRAAFHPMPIDSGWLPPGTLRFGCDSFGTRWLSICVPKTRSTLSIIDNDLGTVRVEVPLPSFIFTGCGRNYWIWAVKDAHITSQAELYHAPLSNVGADGGICFGANRPPEADGSTIQEAFHLFLASPFNGHLANNKSKQHKGDIRYLLQDLASQKASLFPCDDLLPIATRDHPTKALTLDRLLKHVINPRR
jgi:PRTRC genetic system protein B